MTNRAYEIITNRILDALDRGIVPWHKPWRSLVPCSAITGKPYQGINRILLSMSEYGDPRWITYRGAMQLGGHVRAGEKSQTIVKYETFKRVEEKEDGEEAVRRISWMRTYAVFNVEQCEGLTLPQLI